jgi:hypothetical protein
MLEGKQFFAAEILPVLVAARDNIQNRVMSDTYDGSQNDDDLYMNLNRLVVNTRDLADREEHGAPTLFNKDTGLWLEADIYLENFKHVPLIKEMVNSLPGDGNMLVVSNWFNKPAYIFSALGAVALLGYFYVQKGR